MLLLLSRLLMIRSRRRGELIKPTLKVSNVLPHLRQMLDYSIRTPAQARLNCRGAQDYLAVRNIVDYTGFRRNSYVVADVDMTYDADLAPDYAVMSDCGRAGNANLRHKQTMGANLCAVTYRN